VAEEFRGHIDNDPTPNNDVDWGMDWGAGQSILSNSQPAKSSRNF